MQRVSAVVGGCRSDLVLGIHVPDISVNQSHQMNQDHDQDQPERAPDWLAWALHFLFGSVAGFGIGFIVARILLRFGFINVDQLLSVIGGVAICCGAFTSYYGDRAWLLPSIFTLADPPPARKARLCSIIIGIVGVVLVLIPMIIQVTTSGWSTRHSSTMGMTIFTLLIAAIPGFFLFYAFRTGTGLWVRGFIDRDETPLLFWSYVLIHAVLFFCILTSAIR
jgi:hypothetical protein